MFATPRHRLAANANSRKSRRIRRTFTLEPLEERVVLSPTIYTVNSAGSGASGSGTSGALPYVISQANANTNTAGSMIEFESTVFNASSPQTITLTSTLSLSETDGPEVIDGPGASIVSVSGGNAVGVFKVATNATATIQGVTITEGKNTSSDGGGLENVGGTVTLDDCTVSDNTAVFGGGISSAVAGGGITLTSCTVSDNVAEQGGGLFTQDMTTLTNCTVSDNSATEFSGGLLTDSGGATLTNCTVSGNSANDAVGGLDNQGTVTLTDTIVAGNSVGSVASDITGSAAVTGSYNLIGTGGSGGLSNGVDGNIVLTGSETAGLAPLGNYAGPTYTMALLPGSPAIGTGTAVSGITTDQRGEIRGSVVDIGAVQVSLVVESAAGTVVTAPASSLSLPGAVSLADQFADSEITFGPTVFGTETITLASGTLDLTNTVGTTTITGPSAGVTVSGGGAVRVFQVASGVSASLSGLTITGGNATYDGGGLYNYGTVTLDDCTISGNSAGNLGGGMGNLGTA